MQVGTLTFADEGLALHAAGRLAGSPRKQIPGELPLGCFVQPSPHPGSKKRYDLLVFAIEGRQLVCERYLQDLNQPSFSGLETVTIEV